MKTLNPTKYQVYLKQTTGRLQKELPDTTDLKIILDRMFQNYFNSCRSRTQEELFEYMRTITPQLIKFRLLLNKGTTRSQLRLPPIKKNMWKYRMVWVEKNRYQELIKEHSENAATDQLLQSDIPDFLIRLLNNKYRTRCFRNINDARLWAMNDKLLKKTNYHYVLFELNFESSTYQEISL